MKRITAIFIFFCLLLIFPREARADTEFTSSYNVTYDVKESGTTKVMQNIAITNTTSDFYVTEYTLSINSTNVRAVRASDNVGTAKTTVNQNDNFTEIKVTFNEKVAGLGKTLNFMVYYESDDVASHNGRIWEITIPKLADTESITAYNVKILVPSSFGTPSYIYPKPAGASLFFTKDQLEKEGVTILFGSFQTFSYNLKYHLSNPLSNKVYMDIALPPETQYQEISLENITPKPEKIRIDEDGNWLARYTLNPKDKLVVTAQGKSRLYLEAKKRRELTDAQKKKYLEPKKYWETENEKIINLAKTLKTPRLIYNYVVKTLSYDYQRVSSAVERYGAEKILSFPDKSICMEFTDLFIAISRAAGIPARELNGFAYTKNEKLKPVGIVGDILHAWPEYWNEEKKTWIQVDPTWENTTNGVDYFNKLDFNHFVFAIKGLDSEFPYPAGSYKENQQERDVIVEFSPNWEARAPEIDIEIEMPTKVFAGTGIEGRVFIKNKTDTIFPESEIFIDSSPLKLLSEEKAHTKPLPPFGIDQFNINIEKSKLFFKGENTITVKIANRQIKKTVEINPILNIFAITLALGLIAALLVILIIFVVQRKFRKKNEKNLSNR